MGDEDPIARFQETFSRATANATFDPTAVTLATANPAGQPSARMVLFKEADERGFVFFTNYESRKGRQIEANPRAALCFYWPSIGEQVRVEGGVCRLPANESDAYFALRPRDSQLAAWASRQSSRLASRQELEERFQSLEDRFAGQEVPRPSFWGGYRLAPERIEFWHSREHRLHDRWLFRNQAGDWRVERLSP